METGRRAGPADIPAVNRIGRTITCAVTCSPLEGNHDGVVLLMEEITPDTAAGVQHD
jgi:two-component system CheB/CheR fusion protein